LVDSKLNVIVPVDDSDAKVISPASFDAQEVEAGSADWREFVKRQVSRILLAFYILNVLVFSLVACVWWFEFEGILSGKLPAGDRSVTSATFLALIAASATQLGVLPIGTGNVLAKLVDKRGVMKS
jgi:hypothetical protein